MALSTPYCTLQDLADELNNNDGISGDANYDAVVETRWEKAVNRASRMVDEFTQRDFTIHDHSSSMLTVQEKQLVGDMIYLDWPIKTITEIYVDAELEDSDDWLIQGKYGIQYIDDWPLFPFDTNTFIQIKGTFGYTHDDLTTVPNDTNFPEGVRRATAIIAAAISGDYKKDIMDREGGSTQLLITDIPKEAKMLLRRYRRRFF